MKQFTIKYTKHITKKVNVIYYYITKALYTNTKKEIKYYYNDSRI